MKAFGEPTAFKTDMNSAILYIFKKLKNYGFDARTKNCTVKYFNSLIEQDYRQIKRYFSKSAEFQSL
ncbi:hypothetical protein BK708_06565 [Bacillus thuringiensis serovar yunnanensis]|nr:hypothetical protein BK708_06565 [Bacillus thuringiensis serovar yunnanensis]